MAAPPNSFLLGADLEDLRTPAPRIEDIRGPVQGVIDRMLEIIHRGGYPALAGPQVGYRGRVVVLDLSRTGRRPIVLINPEAEAVSRETQIDAEGCLHFPDLTVRRKRPVQLTIRARARSGQPVRMEVGGLMGRILQHHLDHLEGNLLLEPGEAALRSGGRRRSADLPRCSLGWS